MLAPVQGDGAAPVAVENTPQQQPVPPAVETPPAAPAAAPVPAGTKARKPIDPAKRAERAERARLNREIKRLRSDATIEQLRAVVASVPRPPKKAPKKEAPSPEVAPAAAVPQSAPQPAAAPSLPAGWPSPELVAQFQPLASELVAAAGRFLASQPRYAPALANDPLKPIPGPLAVVLAKRLPAATNTPETALLAASLPLLMAIAPIAVQHLHEVIERLRAQREAQLRRAQLTAVPGTQLRDVQPMFREVTE